MVATFTNNSKYTINGFMATVLLKDKNKKTYFSDHDIVVMPGETSPIFKSFAPETGNEDDIEYLNYQINLVKDDNTTVYIEYDAKLKTYKSMEKKEKVKEQPLVTIEELPLDITILEPDSIGQRYVAGTLTNNSQYTMEGFSATVLLKDKNKNSYLCNYDTVMPGETSPILKDFAPETGNKDDMEYLNYSIGVVKDDGTKVYIEYDVKLKTYKSYDVKLETYESME